MIATLAHVKRIAILTFVALIAWQLYSQYRAGAFAAWVPTTPTKPAAATAADGFKCDQRTHCAQMTSCAEAKFFLANCRDADLEVDHRGLPCPRRWCTHPDSP